MAGRKLDNRIREIRIERGLTLVDLADRCATTISTIQKLETGDVRLSLDWMRRLSRALNVALTDLLLDEDRKPYLTPVEERILDAFRDTPADRRAIFLHLVETLARPVPADVVEAVSSWTN